MSVSVLVVVMKMQLFLSPLTLLLFSAAPLSVRNLWVSSSLPAVKGLLVQWENPPVSSSVPPVSQLAVQWHSETRPSTSRWNTVDNFTTSTVIQGATHLFSELYIWENNIQVHQAVLMPMSLDTLARPLACNIDTKCTL